jgi:hypothetical protein
MAQIAPKEDNMLEQPDGLLEVMSAFMAAIATAETPEEGKDQVREIWKDIMERYESLKVIGRMAGAELLMPSEADLLQALINACNGMIERAAPGHCVEQVPNMSIRQCLQHLLSLAQELQAEAKAKPPISPPWENSHNN